MRSTLVWIITIMLLLGLAACGSSPAEPTKPTVKFTSTTLVAGSAVEVGEAASIEYEAADVAGIVQVEITINGEPIHIETISPPVNVFSGAYSWTPEDPGSYLIQLVAFNVGGLTSDLVQLAVTAEGEAVAEAEPTATEVVEPTATTVPPTATPEPALIPPTPSSDTPTPEPTPTATPTEEAVVPLMTANVALNVRSGPSTDYPVLGRLAEGTTAEIIGQDEFGNWWVIEFLADESGRGWVASGPEFSSAADAEDVPIVEAPALENTDDDSSASTQPITPQPGPTNLPVINSFSADRNEIGFGETVTLSWDLENATEAYLRYGNAEEGVVSPGSKSFTPGSDTTYTLVTRNENGEVTAEVTITVGGATPTPATPLGSGQLQVANGQAINFEDGSVVSDGDPGIDFVWDGEELSFSPRNGAAGVLVGKGFNDITLADCSGASYGAPITGVDESRPIIGCYKTDQGRFGKFVISSWNLAATLTIDWLTWQ